MTSIFETSHCKLPQSGKQDTCAGQFHFDKHVLKKEDQLYMFLITERYNCLQILLSKVTMEKGNDELTGATVICLNS